jgi:hypothetical protein
VRYAKRVDANQEQIVSVLRAAGAYVWIIGLPVDLLVGYKNRTILVEIKSTTKSKFTPLQKEFFLNWCGDGLVRVNDPEGALRMLKCVDTN